MKPTEIQIGDLLTFEDCLNDEAYPVIQVTGILQDSFFARIDDDKADDELDYKGVAGIPLTAEILEKNWFEKLDFSHFQIGDRRLVLDADGRWDGPLSWHWVVTEMDTNAKGQPVVLDYYVATINYVHELQHCLKLVGIKKDIVL